MSSGHFFGGANDFWRSVSCFAVPFNFMRSILRTLVVLSLWVPQAKAQSAVLIGLHVYTGDDGNREQPPSYRTLLIVPRKDGFWRVGACTKDLRESMALKNSSMRFLPDLSRTPLASIILTTPIGDLRRNRPSHH
jgi:hypothetical protein